MYTYIYPLQILLQLICDKLLGTLYREPVTFIVTLEKVINNEA